VTRLTLTFDVKTRIGYRRKKGQIFLNVPIVCEGSTDSDAIDFIYDTGAYITVINKERYERYGLDKLPRKEASIGGYDGSTPGYVFQIPGLIIGKRLLSGVWAFSPISEDIKQNLLGDNVIEYFRPFQDNLNDCFYFADNPKPEPYTTPDKSASLACDKVLLIEDMEK
jgi:hypothetical protein